jgi:hypothetical protein
MAGVLVGAALGAAGGPAEAGAQGWREQISRQINSSMIASARREGYGDAGGPLYDLVASGSRRSLRIPLAAGQSYRVIAQCDYDCSDVDFKLYDENDNLISEDSARDDVPLISATPRRSAPFRLEVTMASCSTRQCGWGVAIVAK